MKKLAGYKMKLVDSFTDDINILYELYKGHQMSAIRVFDEDSQKVIHIKLWPDFDNARHEYHEVAREHYWITGKKYYTDAAAMVDVKAGLITEDAEYNENGHRNMHLPYGKALERKI
jgi:hypothetical protein